MANPLYDADHLYALLPEVLRHRDLERTDGQPPGALRDLVELLAREARVVARDIERLHENSFIETCDSWAVPYLGDLLGVEGLRPDRPVSARAEVAHTLGYRKRKGTAAVLEQLARDVTGWPARVVESFQLLAWSQFVHSHVRPEAMAPAAIRNADAMEQVNSPFDTAAHSVDIGRAVPRDGRHNIPQVILHLFRLYALPQLLTTPHPQPNADDVGGQVTRFRFSSLGHDVPLFTHPVAETGPTSIAQEIHVPTPIRRRALQADLEGEAELYVGAGLSIAVLVPTADDWQPLAARYVACNLEDWDRPLPAAHEPEEVGGVIAIDPKLGRLRFQDRERVPEVFRLASYHGFADRLGGGQYDRSAPGLSTLDPITSAPEANRFQVGDGTDPLLVARDDVDTAAATFFEDLFDALVAPWPAEGDRLIEIVDSRNHAVDLAELAIPAGRRLVIRAEDRQRPTIELARTLTVVGEEDSELDLDGLWIGGAGLVIAAPPPDGDGQVPLGLDRLTIRHSTLVPGHALGPDGAPTTPGAVSLRIETGETEATVERSLLGAVRTAPETRFELVDSALDAHAVSTPGNPDVAAAFAGLGDAPEEPLYHGGRLIARRCTLFGSVRASVMELVDNSLLMGDALAERRQEGCVRYTWVTPRSRVPRRWRCQPEPPEDATALDIRRLENRLRPCFTSRTYGRPGYAQLDWRAPEEILRGADNGSEMGLFSALQGPLREDDLRRRLDEYLPASLEAGIFYAT